LIGRQNESGGDWKDEFGLQKQVYVDHVYNPKGEYAYESTGLDPRAVRQLGEQGKEKRLLATSNQVLGGSVLHLPKPQSRGSPTRYVKDVGIT